MSLFDFLAFFVVIGGLVYGFWYGIDQGFGHALWGALVSAGFAYLIYAIMLLGLMLMLSLWLCYRPTFPRCKKGCCSVADYRYLYLDTPPPEQDKALQDEKKGLLVRCKCDDLYLECMTGNLFYAVLEDRTLVPYMCFKPLGRWQPVHALNGPPTKP